MPNSTLATYIAFLGNQKIAEGCLLEVALKTKKVLKDEPSSFPLLVFDVGTSAQIELDLRGTESDIQRRLGEPGIATLAKQAGPGRPKLGVISREISLLPQHWDWLAQQRGSASVTLRNLVEAAKKNSGNQDQVRSSQNATYKFATAMAGNLPHFEDALRSLFAKNKENFEKLVDQWPSDIRDHVKKLSGAAFQ